MRLPLKTKFSAMVLGIILTMMFSIWMLSIHQQSKMEEAIAEQERAMMRVQLVKRAGNIFGFLAANSEALAIGDYLTVDAFIREITTWSNDIRLIQIVRNGHVVVPISDSDTLPLFQPPAWLKPAGKTVQSERIETPEGEQLLVTSGPVIDKSINRRVADAYVVISRSSIHEAMATAQEEIRRFGNDARYNMTIATVIFAILGIVGSILLVTYVVRPIHTLAKGARIVGEGNLDHEVVVQTNDEVGDLARMFNLMTKNLKEDQIQLVEKEKLEQELNIAMQIQQTLLPKSLPHVDGYDFGAIYTAAREVGGDYYDFMDIRGNNGHQRIAVVVADVSGKGVPGAFMMAVTRSILRATASDTLDPASVLKSTNAILQPDIKPGMFVSMYYGILSADTGEMEFCSAGHNPTLIYRARTGKVESVRCKGLALGLRHAQIFDHLIESKRIELNPGDIFFQYTDGIPHAMNSREERFGMERLISCIHENNRLPAQALVDRALEQVIGFTAGGVQFDDITMVAVRRGRPETGG